MTVVIRTHGLLLRADVQAGDDLRVTLWRQDWPDLSAAVAYALGEGGKPGKRVWVLDSEVWLGTVDLPAGAVAGQSDKDLAGPAAYEAEAVSDLSPIEAVTSVQRRRMADQGDQFLVTQTRRADVAAVAKIVRSAGAKFAGLGHPAGLAAALQFEQHSGQNEGWRRVEFWYESVVLVESVGGRLGLIPLGLGPRSDWRRALAPHLKDSQPVSEDQTLIGPGVRVRGGTQWRESTAVDGTARWLAAGEDQADEDDGVPTWDLADDSCAERFVQAWVKQLEAIKPGDSVMAPTLRPPKAPASRWPAAMVGVIAVALAVLTVVSLRQDATDQLVELQAQIDHELREQQVVADRRENNKQSKVDLRKKQKWVSDLEAQLEKLRRQQASSQNSNITIDRRAALSAMMASLTNSNSEAIMVQSIEHGSPKHEVAGMATSPEAATGLARDLSKELRGLWIVSPPNIEPEADALQVAWRFTITIEPVMTGEAQQ
ncbi:MAG: hypothetical protein AAF085_09890 [Planctomycetota bacterium]